MPSNTTQVPQLIINYKLADNMHKIYFTDNGIGIDKAFHKTIFTPFKRLHTRQEYPGVGLGLASVERIVKEHLNGSISLISAVNNGSTFIIEFPIQE